MAAVQGQIGELTFDGMTDKRRSTAANAVANTALAANPNSYSSLNALETLLLSNGYTQATLNIMNLNDKVYAARRVDGGSI